MKRIFNQFINHLYKQKQAFVLFTSEGLYYMQASVFFGQIRHSRLFFFPVRSDRSFCWYENNPCLTELISAFIRCYQLEGQRITIIIDGHSLFFKQVALPIHNKKDALQSIQWDIAQYIKNGDYCQVEVEPIGHNGITTVWLLAAYGRESLQGLTVAFKKEQAVLTHIDSVPTVMGRVLRGTSPYYILVINGNILYSFILKDGIPDGYCKLDYSRTTDESQLSFWNSIRNLLQHPRADEHGNIPCMLIWPLVGTVPKIPMDICCRRIDKGDLKDHCQQLANAYDTPAQWLLAAIVAEDTLG